MFANQVLLLTAAVSPSSDVPFTALDPAVRLELYQKAFSKWEHIATTSAMKLCILETTGSSLADFKFANPQEIMFISHIPPARLHPRGKGALEAHALDVGFDTIGKIFGPDVTVHKITGRLAIPNWASIFEMQSPSSLRIRRSLDRSTCDTRVFSTTPGSWQRHFRKCDQVVDDNAGIYLEHAIGHRSIVAEFNDPTFHLDRFARIPRVNGISGSSGKKYGGLSKDGLSNALSHIEQFVLPPFGRRLI
jgi:hypothetical protein